MGDPYSGLSSDSRTILDQYHQWSRLSYEMMKRGASVDAANQQVGNVLQETYTRDDLRRSLTGQTSLLLHSLDSRMEPFIEATASLLRAVLRDADRQRVALSVDAGAVLGAGGAPGARRLLDGPSGRLAPLTVEAAAGEAGRQLLEANAEVRRLQEKLRRLTDEHSRAMAARGASAADADNAKALEAQPGDGDAQGTIAQLRAEAAEAKRELSVRISQSSQYQQLRRILTQKNELIRTMRARLEQCDPTFCRPDVEDDMEEEEG